MRREKKEEKHDGKDPSNKGSAGFNNIEMTSY
jgi:hypothetical protein